MRKRDQQDTINFDLWCPSIRSDYLNALQDSLQNIEIKIIPQMSNPSFASLCNFAFAESSSEYVLIANDKSRPEQSDIQKILLKLKEGFGIVGLYRFGFFGVSRELINEMGGFDTRFVDGGYEDNDLLLRFKELDIAVYMQEEIKYITGKISLWRQENSSRFFWEKYKIDDVNCEIFQTIQHEVQPNKLKIKKMNFLPFSESQLCAIPLVTMENNFTSKLISYDYYPKKTIKVFAISHADNLSRAFNGLELQNELLKYGIEYNLKSDIHQRNTGKSITPKIFRGLQKVVGKMEFVTGYQSRLYFWTRLIAYSKDFKNADVVHLHILHNNFFRIEALKYFTKKKPTVWTFHDLWIATGHCIQPLDCRRFSHGCGSCPALNRTLAVKRDRTSKELKRKINLLKKMKCNYIVSSNWMEKKIKSVHMIEKEKLHLLPFGVPSNKFYSDLEVRRNYRKALNIEEEAFLVFINAHNDEIKGIDVVKDLFNSFPTHSAIKFVVVDESELFNETPNVIRVRRISEPSDMNGILNAADVVLIPSLGESFSLLTLEAMNCARPVICLKNSAPNELIGHDSELVFRRSESSKKIIEIILELASDNERVEREGLNNQTRALREYSFDRYAQNHVKIYSRLLVQAKPR